MVPSRLGTRPASDVPTAVAREATASSAGPSVVRSPVHTEPPTTGPVLEAAQPPGSARPGPVRPAASVRHGLPPTASTGDSSTLVVDGDRGPAARPNGFTSLRPTLGLLNRKPDPRPGTPLVREPTSSPVTDAVVDETTGQTDVIDDTIVQDRPEPIIREKSLQVAPPRPMVSRVKGAPGGEPFAPSFPTLSVGGEARSVATDDPRGEKGGFLGTTSVGGRDVDIEEPSIPATTRDSGSPSEGGLAVAPVPSSSTGGDATAGGQGDGGSEQPMQRSTAPEAEPFTPEGDIRSVVAEADDARVEIQIRRDGLEVRLDAADLQRFDGLEDELRAALRHGDADLLDYEAHERSDAHERREADEGRPDARRQDARGRRRGRTHETREDGSPRRIGRGSLVDILA